MPKVALVKCNSYEINDVYEALNRGINLLGGIDKFLNKDEKILLKPNLLRGKPPEAAVTTHPSVMDALFKILKENNYTKLSFGDSPGVGSTKAAANEAGLAEVGEKYNIPLVEFDKGEAFSNKDNTFTKQFEIAYPVLETDALINIAKMKSHKLTRITGAAKNLLGCVYGLNKGSYHAKFPNGILFSKMLADLAVTIKPRLNIIDGILAMEGEGPGSGDPINMNLLILSEDAFAADYVFAKIVDLDINYLPIYEHIEKSGYGHYCDETVEIIGDNIEEFINKDFDVERRPIEEEKGISLSNLALIKNFILKKPVIINDRCTRCRQCERSCPLDNKAVVYNKEKKKMVFNYNDCIRCYCCGEMCPEKAIYVKTPLLSKLLIR